MRQFYSGMLCLFAIATLSWAADLPVEVSWIGNSVGGVDGMAVQNFADAVLVRPDGRVYVNSMWDESGRECGFYQDNKVVGKAEHLHGWGRSGGYAVAANNSYIYIGMSISGDDGGNTRLNKNNLRNTPDPNHIWYGVQRYDKKGVRVPFSSGHGTLGTILQISSGSRIREGEPYSGQHVYGLWATEAELFVSDTQNNLIKVYDAGTMAFLREFPFTRPGAIVSDKNNSLWIVQRADEQSPAQLIEYSMAGVNQNRRILLGAGVEATGLAYDNFNNANRLMVFDQGADQNVKFYSLDQLKGETAGISETFGVTGGYLSGPPEKRGTTGPLRFANPAGGGVDREGNLYVVNLQVGSSGIQIEKYRRDGGLLWSLQGNCFVDTAVVDPDDETHVYTKDEHYVMDYSQPAGKQWKMVGYTVDRLAAPDDPRLGLNVKGTSRWITHVQQVVRMDGKLFLVTSPMHTNSLSGTIQFYKFNRQTHGEIALMSTRFKRKHASSWGTWIDSRNHVWEASVSRGIWKVPFTGVDANGDPTFGYEQRQAFAMPAPLTEIYRIVVDAAGNAYLSGYTAEQKWDGKWKTVGKVLCRYDNFENGKPTAPRWQIVLDWDSRPTSYVVEGDYVFVVSAVGRGAVWVYRAEDGQFVGKMMPDESVGGLKRTGWVDVPYGVSAHRRANGEYLVFVEEDFFAKVLMYRWKPAQ